MKINVFSIIFKKINHKKYVSKWDKMLEEIFGNDQQIKVIDYFLMNPFGELTQQQIAIGCEISESALKEVIEDLIKNEILIKGENSKYKVNLKSPIIYKFNLILDELCKIEIEKQMKNLDEPYDELSDEELDKIFDENTSDLDLYKLEKEISLNESYKKINEIKNRNNTLN